MSSGCSRRNCLYVSGFLGSSGEACRSAVAPGASRPCRRNATGISSVRRGASPCNCPGRGREATSSESATSTGTSCPPGSATAWTGSPAAAPATTARVGGRRVQAVRAAGSRRPPGAATLLGPLSGPAAPRGSWAPPSPFAAVAVEHMPKFCGYTIAEYLTVHDIAARGV